MNINGVQTPLAGLSASTVGTRADSNNTRQSKSVLGTTQGYMSELSRRAGIQHYPPLMPPVPYPSNQQSVIGTVQQMMNMLMQILREFPKRPQPEPPYTTLPVRPEPFRPGSPITIMPVRPGLDLDSLIGMRVNEARAKALEGGASQVRVIYPGVPQTMDYRANRLNLVVDQSGLVTRAYKG